MRKSRSLPWIANQKRFLPGFDIYQYLEVDKEQLNDIAEVGITFRVPTDWVEDNAIDLSSITLYRFADRWEALPTMLVMDDTITGTLIRRMPLQECSMLGVLCWPALLALSITGDIVAEDAYTFRATSPGLSLFAIGGSVASPVCESGQSRCVGNDLAVCDAGKEWTIIQSCDFGCNPTTNACNTESVQICAPDVYRCEGDVLQQCSPAGTYWELLEVCAYGCVENACAPPPNQGVDWFSRFYITFAILASVMLVISLLYVFNRRRGKRPRDEAGPAVPPLM